jgi:hypothetical protein
MSQGKITAHFYIQHSSGTPSDTQFGTPSDTLSGTPSYTKTMGELAVVILTTSDGKISDMGFLCAHGLHLLSF